jgi:hypothetical protein
VTKGGDPDFAHRTRTNRREEPLPVERLLQYLDIHFPDDPETDANPTEDPS